mgnify:CR=1 FL=1
MVGLGWNYQMGLKGLEFFEKNIAIVPTFRIDLALVLAFSFYVQFFKTSLFPIFSHFINFFSKYNYTLAYFQQKVLNKKLDI